MSAQLNYDRDIAVQAVTLALAPYAAEKIDVNRLMRVYEAYKLFGEGKPHADRLSYDVWKQHLSRLVYRHNADKIDEVYLPLEGYETECQALVDEALSGKWTVTKIAEKVGDCVRAHTAKVKEDKRVEAEKARLALASAQEQVADAKKDTKAATVVVQQAEKELQTELAKPEAEKNPEKVADLSAAIETATKTLLETQEAEIAVNQTAADAARDAVNKEKDRRAADKAHANQVAKDKRDAEKKLQKQSERPKSPEARQGANLIKTVANESDAQVCEFIMELLEECEAPDDVFELVLKAVKNSEDMSRPSQRAANAALMSLENSKRQPLTQPPTVPVPVPEVNPAPLAV